MKHFAPKCDRLCNNYTIYTNSVDIFSIPACHLSAITVETAI